MKNSENQKVGIYISYKAEMTLLAMEKSLRLLNEAMAEFSERNGVRLNEKQENSPKVVSVSNGSLFVDVIVPIACELIPILYDIIKTRSKANPEYTINLYSNSNRMKWTKEDNYKVSKEVLKVYAVKKQSLSINDFSVKLALALPYSRQSIKAKIQNTKYLMESKNIPNTLNTASLANYSQMHKEQFEKACKDLKI